jgi:putative ABC transport system ATP-binding protein
VRPLTPSATLAPLLIETRKLSRLGQSDQNPLLHATDFILRGGDKVAITGPSGSGKSVFLRTLALLEAPDSGEVLWRDQVVTSALVPRYRSRISYIAQRPALIEGSVEDNLRFPFSLTVFKGQTFDIEQAVRMLRQAGKPLSFMSKMAGDLSGGESQVVALIRALQLDPQVLLLDEPTAALDPQSARDVEGLVDTWLASGSVEERACIWVSHDPEQARRMSNMRFEMLAGSLSRMAGQ